tara:strand:- start:871 stop:1245 length:375 start_codon:yes stop_codon:yes gene_type:complete
MSNDHGHFIIPIKYYIGTFISLLILTVITVAISRVDLGILNDPVAIGLAIIKATLVLLFFMGLKWDKGISTVLILGSVSAILIFFLLTYSDLGFRGTIYETDKGIHNINSPVKLIKPGEQSSHH